MEQLITNRTSKASCLIYKWKVDDDGQTAIVELWSDKEVDVGTQIAANHALYFQLNPTNSERFAVREWRVTDVLGRRNFKGMWEEDAEVKNKNNYWTLKVVPDPSNPQPKK
jgi:hypothetical protein